MLLLRRLPTPDGQRRSPDQLGYAYRVSDPARFAAWLARISSDPAAELEVVQRRLRLVDHGPATAETTLPTLAPIAAALQPLPTELPAPVEPAVVDPAVVSAEAVAARIVALIAEQTGYPAEMLAADLDLEADLGIDTVKQAELFATIRGEYGIERDDNLKLRDYPTINHVVGFVRDRTPQPTTTPPATTPPAAVAATPATVEPAVVEPAVVEPAVSVEAVAARIVALIAEQTGYPAEMLAADLDLEADLGIDTVKQAELFATIRGEYGIARDDNLKLRDYPTINHVVGFVQDRTPQPTTNEPATTPPATVVPEPAVTAPAVSVEAVAARIVALIAEQTGYPAEMLAADLDLEADLGIDTVKQAELFATIRGEYGIARDDNLKLRDYPTINHVVGFVQDRTPQPTATPPATDASTIKAADIAPSRHRGRRRRRRG